MLRLSTLTLALGLGIGSTFAQTCDLVFFTDDGQKFTLIVDGDPKNATPATRVVATGLRNETPMCVVHFEDKGIPDVKKSGFFPLGKEYTIMVTTNKKGERVYRPSGEAALGTAASTTTDKPKPANFQDDGATQTQQTMATQTVGTGTTGVTTTTTVTDTQDSDAVGENVNMSIGVNGVGLNMNVNMNDGMGGTTGTTSTSHTTTTTTTTSSQTVNGSNVEVQEEDDRPSTTATRPAKPGYSMPGYSGPIGCPYPMSSMEFDDAKKSIEGKSFEDTRMTMAKQIARDHCFTADQVKGFMALFSFEDNKLEFAKFAYDHTYDTGNYYKVNDGFSFETSVDELNQYIQSR